MLTRACDDTSRRREDIGARMSPIYEKLGLSEHESAVKCATIESKKDTSSIPLIRLRVEHSGYQSISNQKFGQRFVGQVANADSVLHLYKRKRADDRGDKRTGIPDIQIEDTRVEDIQDLIVRYLDDNQNLNILVESDLNNAVQDYIYKMEGAAIDIFVKKSVARAQEAVREEPDVDCGDVEALRYRLRRVVDVWRKNSMEQFRDPLPGVKTESAEVPRVASPKRPSAKKGSAATKTAGLSRELSDDSLFECDAQRPRKHMAPCEETEPRRTKARPKASPKGRPRKSPGKSPVRKAPRIASPAAKTNPGRRKDPQQRSVAEMMNSKARVAPTAGDRPTRSEASSVASPSSDENFLPSRAANTSIQTRKRETEQRNAAADIEVDDDEDADELLASLTYSGLPEGALRPKWSRRQLQ
eukprot:Polyplicarium_translucidae@DN1510_c0_g1_i2.p1